MKKLILQVSCLGLVALLHAGAQAQVQNIQARISGGGGTGKCTFEVVVNGSAEVQIREGRVSCAPYPVNPRLGAGFSAINRCRATPTTSASPASTATVSNIWSEILAIMALLPSASTTTGTTWKATPATLHGAVAATTAEAGRAGAGKAEAGKAAMAAIGRAITGTGSGSLVWVET